MASPGFAANPLTIILLSVQLVILILLLKQRHSLTKESSGVVQEVQGTPAGAAPDPEPVIVSVIFALSPAKVMRVIFGAAIRPAAGTAARTTASKSDVRIMPSPVGLARLRRPYPKGGAPNILGFLPSALRASLGGSREAVTLIHPPPASP